MNADEEFYIGWQSRMPPTTGTMVRNVVVLLVAFGLTVASVLALAQRSIGVAAFEWGTTKTFQGILRSNPYPHLLVDRPGPAGNYSAYYLVAPFKFGLKADQVAAFHGKSVTLKGTLIYRGNQTMIEVRPESIQANDVVSNPVTPTASTSLGRQTLVGEIVDSKCYFGVMNPGRLATHRACAVRCVSGGIPPVLLVRQATGPALYFLLVSADGRPVNKQVLDMIAEPVQITGEVVRQGDLLILRADPATYQRLRR